MHRTYIDQAYLKMASKSVIICIQCTRAQSCKLAMVPDDKKDDECPPNSRRRRLTATDHLYLENTTMWVDDRLISDVMVSVEKPDDAVGPDVSSQTSLADTAQPDAFFFLFAAVLIVTALGYLRCRTAAPDRSGRRGCMPTRRAAPKYEQPPPPPPLPCPASSAPPAQAAGRCIDWFAGRRPPPEGAWCKVSYRRTSSWA